MYDAEIFKAESTYTARKEDYLLYEADEMGIMRFLTTDVDESWYRELEMRRLYTPE